MAEKATSATLTAPKMRVTCCSPSRAFGSVCEIQWFRCHYLSRFDGNGQKTAEAGAAAAYRGSRQPVARKAREKAGNGDLPFHARDAQAGALVHAEAEPQMPVGLARDVQAV